MNQSKTSQVVKLSIVYCFPRGSMNCPFCSPATISVLSHALGQGPWHCPHSRMAMWGPRAGHRTQLQKKTVHGFELQTSGFLLTVTRWATKESDIQYQNMIWHLASYPLDFQEPERHFQLFILLKKKCWNHKYMVKSGKIHHVWGWVSKPGASKLNPGTGYILEGTPDPSAENITAVNKLLFSPCQYGFSKTNSTGQGAPSVVII